MRPYAYGHTQGVHTAWGETQGAEWERVIASNAPDLSTKAPPFWVRWLVGLIFTFY